MNKIKIVWLFLFFAFAKCEAYQELGRQDDYIFEVYEPGDFIPSEQLEEGHRMYRETYNYPSLHEGISLSTLKIDPTRFKSYDDFIDDMFQRDFQSYQDIYRNSRFYFQVRQAFTNKILAICSLLNQDQPGYYYLDHIGTHKDFKRKRLALTLLKWVEKTCTDYIVISLDTRVFNYPAHALYEKAGYKKLKIHPNPKKQDVYYHYVLKHKEEDM